MLDFITAPLIVGIVTLGIYRLFELYVRKKERLALIEKAGERIDPSIVQNNYGLLGGSNLTGKFTSLKVGCLLLGVGVGLLVGFMIGQYYYGELMNKEDVPYFVRETIGVIYGSSVLLFGGLGLLISFLVEVKLRKK